MAGLILPYGLIRGGYSALDITYRDRADQQGATDPTFSGLSIGTASADRHILVGIMMEDGTSTPLSTVTVNGSQSCTRLATVENPGAPGDRRLSFHITDAPITSGTTCSVEVTNGVNMNDTIVWVWTITGTAGTLNLYDSDSEVTSVNQATGTTTVDFWDGGVAASIYVNYESNDGAIAWSGLTEDTDFFLGLDNYSSASDDLAATSTGNVITATFSGQPEEELMILTVVIRG